MARKWRVAVIGHTGKGNYGHGLDTVWLGFDNVEIVAVADPDANGLAAAAHRIKAKNAYADYRQMLDKERPQIVAIGERWLGEHRNKVLACAEHGANIFLEKPMCRTLAEADEMIAACEKHHVKLAIAHQSRHSPRAQHVKELILSGRLGDLLELRGRGKEDVRGGGEDLMVLGTHIFDLMRFFAGDPRWCHAQIWVDGKMPQTGQFRDGAEQMGPIVGDRLHANYGFDNALMASFGSHRARFGASQRFALQILGSKGIIYMQSGALPLTLFCDDPAWLPGRKGTWQEITSAGIGKPEPIKDSSLVQGNRWIVQDLFAAIEKDRQPLGSMYDGRGALEMIMAVYESYRLHRSVEMPLKNRRHPLSSV